jgi:hypothetical protein
MLAQGFSQALALGQQLLIRSALQGQQIVAQMN